VPPAEHVALEARDVACVRGRRVLFEHLSFALRPGECLELRGPNGSGKTSLLRMLCGLLPPSNGAIFWRGDPIATLREAYHPFVRYVGHASALKDELTTMENLRVLCALNGFELSCDEAQAVLHRMTLSHEAHLPARYLSAGQRRRLALARLIATPAPLWLLDEVFTSLDESAAHVTASVLDDHLACGGLAIVATHQDLRLAARWSQRIELVA